MLFLIKSSFNVIVCGISVYALVNVINLVNGSDTLMINEAPKAMMNL